MVRAIVHDPPSTLLDTWEKLLMGYNTSLTGRLDIDPPLNWKEAQCHPLFVPDGEEPKKALKLLIDEDSVETDDGPLRRRRGVALVFAWDYPVVCYDILQELQAAIDHAGPQRTYSGEMEATGSDWNDLWKLTVIDGRAARLVPTITWPDGTVEQNDRYKDKETRSR